MHSYASKQIGLEVGLVLLSVNGAPMQGKTGHEVHEIIRAISPGEKVALKLQHGLTEAAAALLHVGDRVNVTGYCAGTVKYVGPHKVNAAKGLRVLVHLDKAIGKNNGAVGGKCYSPQQLGENEGVLVTARKVGKLSSEMEGEIARALASIFDSSLRTAATRLYLPNSNFNEPEPVLQPGGGGGGASRQTGASAGAPTPHSASKQSAFSHKWVVSEDEQAASALSFLPTN